MLLGEPLTQSLQRVSFILGHTTAQKIHCCYPLLHLPNQSSPLLQKKAGKKSLSRHPLLCLIFDFQRQLMQITCNRKALTSISILPRPQFYTHTAMPSSD